MNLDRFDRHLLNLVQEDASQTAEQLAAAVPLSVSAIQRRLKRLRETGIIQRDIAVVDPKQVGRPTFFSFMFFSCLDVFCFSFVSFFLF